MRFLGGISAGGSGTGAVDSDGGSGTGAVDSDGGSGTGAVESDGDLGTGVGSSLSSVVDGVVKDVSGGPSVPGSPLSICQHSHNGVRNTWTLDKSMFYFLRHNQILVQIVWTSLMMILCFREPGLHR